MHNPKRNRVLIKSDIGKWADQIGERGQDQVASYAVSLQMRPIAEFMIRKCITPPLTMK